MICVNVLKKIVCLSKKLNDSVQIFISFFIPAENIFSQVADTKLHSIIDTIYLNTSKRVLDMVVGPHKLLDHLQAMRRYLLLGQGDFICSLMENLKWVLYMLP